MIKIQCKYDELININKLKPHIKNRNKHPKDQINMLAELIKYQGFRAPLIISNLSNTIVKGCGTLLACKKLNMKFVPVVYQEFIDTDQEYAFIQSDNSISKWSELDFANINIDIADLDPSFNINLLGIKNFEIEYHDKNVSKRECPVCGFNSNKRK